jgi:enamine deaminase RidA (YjgF/YER057c/UK114 family)
MFEQRVSELGLQLPPEPLLPKGIRIPFEWVRVVGERCVPSEVPPEAAQDSARLTVLAMLGALRGALGSLDWVRDWVTVSGFVNADPGYPQTTSVLNSAPDLPLEVFGEHGRHARTAIGVAALPLNLPVIMSAEVIVTP